QDGPQVDIRLALPLVALECLAEGGDSPARVVPRIFGNSQIVPAHGIARSDFDGAAEALFGLGWAPLQNADLSQAVVPRLAVRTECKRQLEGSRRLVEAVTFGKGLSQPECGAGRLRIQAQCRAEGRDRIVEAPACRARRGEIRPRVHIS